MKSNPANSQDLHDLLQRLRFDGAGEIEQRERRTPSAA